MFLYLQKPKHWSLKYENTQTTHIAYNPTVFQSVWLSNLIWSYRVQYRLTSSHAHWKMWDRFGFIVPGKSICAHIKAQMVQLAPWNNRSMKRRKHKSRHRSEYHRHRWRWRDFDYICIYPGKSLPWILASLCLGWIVLTCSLCEMVVARTLTKCWRFRVAWYKLSA